MAQNADDSTEIKETDIVFDCPYCGKSLAIDYRGAGLSITCTDCGKSVAVPIPEGMEITDVDSTEEEQQTQILNLRRSLAAAETRIAQLESEIENMTLKCNGLENSRADSVHRTGTILQKCDVIQRALTDASDALGKISEAAAATGQPHSRPQSDPES